MVFSGAAYAQIWEESCELGYISEIRYICSLKGIDQICPEGHRKNDSDPRWPPVYHALCTNVPS